MNVSLEVLLRETTLVYGHIQLFRDKHGWQASVCHHGPPQAQTDNPRACADPVEALSKALLEDARKTRDFQRKYQIAKSEPRQIEIEEAIEASRSVKIPSEIPDGDEEFEDILG